MLTTISEQLTDWRTTDLTVEQETQLVRGIVLSGDQSANGRSYTTNALMAAVPLYAQKPVFLDHAANPTRPLERSTRDLAGTIVNPRWEQRRIVGDLQLVDTEAGRTLMALISANAPAVGMSHVVLVEKGADPRVIEKIHDVVSVDAVAYPATTQGFREARDEWTGSYEGLLGAIDQQLLSLTPDVSESPGEVVGIAADQRWQRVAVFPDYVVCQRRTAPAESEFRRTPWIYAEGRVQLGTPEAVLLEALPPDVLSVISRRVELVREKAGDRGPEPDVAAGKGEIDTEFEALKQSLAVLQQERAIWQQAEATRSADDEIDQLLTAAQLPGFAKTDSFLSALRRSESRESRRRLLAEQQALVRRCRQITPCSHSPAGAVDSRDRELIAAIKQGRQMQRGRSQAE